MTDTRRLVLTTLDEAAIAVEIAARPDVFRPASSFHAPVILTNRMDRAATWSAEHPLHLAYRWIDQAGTTVERDGIRTMIPDPLTPGTPVKVVMSGVTPDEPGTYRLLASLVLEGVHWASDRGSDGWTEVDVDVQPGPAWPSDLRASAGGRALRGALAAAELQRLLEGKTFEVFPPPALVEADTVEVSRELVAATIASPTPSLAGRLRHWLRRVLGVRNLQQDLQSVANAVTRQEQRSTDLQLQLDRIEQALHLRLNGAETMLKDLQDQAAAERHAAEAEARRVAQAQVGKLTDVERAVAHMAEQDGKTASRLDRSLGIIRGAIADLQSDGRSSALQVGNRLIALHANLDEQRVALIGLRSGSEQVTDAVNALHSSQHDLVRELREGSVVVELISTLRDVAAWAQASGQTNLLGRVEEGIAQLLQEMRSEVGRRNGESQALAVRADQTSIKLDALLTRQAIPLASAGLVLVRNRFGLLAIQEEDVAAIAYYLSGDLPEPGTVALVERYLEPGDCFLDVGANVGIYSLIAGRKVGAGGRVIAIEPMPSTMHALRTTLAVNGVVQIVDARECALGASAGTATLYAGTTSGHSTLLEGPERGPGQHQVTIERGDDLLKSTEPTLIKIDVEGWELDVLEGLQGTIRRSPNLAMIVECSPGHIRRRNASPAEWFDRIRSWGLSCWLIDDEHMTLQPLEEISGIDDRGANLLFSRKLPERLKGMLA